jgi:dTDP-4-dehydrorhamnose reductase
VNGWDVNGQLNPRLVSIVEQLKTGITIMRLNQAFITPTLVDNLAECLLEVSDPSFRYRGVLHLAGGEQISYYDFAKMIARRIQADEGLILADTSRSWNIALESLHTQRILNTRLLGVKEQINRIFT